MIFRKQIVLCGCCFQVIFVICLQFETVIFGLKTYFRPICAGFVVMCLCNILRFLYYYRCMRPFCAIHFAVKPFRIIWKASYKSLPDLDIKFFCLIFVPDGYETESYDVRRVREPLRSDDVCRPLRYLHDCRYYNPCGGLVCFFRQKHLRMHTRPRLPGRKPGFSVIGSLIQRRFYHETYQGFRPRNGGESGLRFRHHGPDA